MGKEWRMFILCWFAYASAYLCRTNLSIAAPKMLETFNWSKSNIGLIAGIFFWTYAVGQLVNGYIGDKVRSRPFIFVSLASASIINIIMGFSKVKWSFIILWGMNGFFLSMLWGPILRILSFWFPPEKGTRVGMGISTSSTVGYLVSWGLLGQLIANTSWQWAFWAPGIFVLLFSFIWLFRVPEHPGYDVHKTREEPRLSLMEMILKSRLWLIALACIAQGVLKEGIALWGPTFLGDVYALEQREVAKYSLAIPIMSLLGIFLAGWLNERLKSQERYAVLLLLAGTGLSCLGLYLSFKAHLFAGLLFLGLASALSYGANTLLLTIIPLKFAKYNRVSTVAGYLDFSSYVGSALGGLLSGYMLDFFGWRTLILSWTLFSALAGILVLVSGAEEVHYSSDESI